MDYKLQWITLPETNIAALHSKIGGILKGKAGLPTTDFQGLISVRLKFKVRMQRATVAENR